MRYLDPHEIADWAPDPSLADAGRTALHDSNRVLTGLGLAGPGQQMGQRWAVGCVALEITQRCNLDCTACYLSDHSEAVRDIPLEAVFARIDAIAAHYGPGTDVQVTGGDPTLRKPDELEAIVARVASLGMRPTLMTNGIKASEKLLRRLASAGLMDVAFHVDTTQERKGFSDEQSLHVLRDRYLNAAAAAGLSVMFNTTLHGGNFHELPLLVRYFLSRAKSLRTASFQLQADTGRGLLRTRDTVITKDTAIAAIEREAGTALGFDASLIGHPDCTRYALSVSVGDKVVPLFDNAELVRAVQQETADVTFHRDRPLATAWELARRFALRPRLVARTLPWLARKLRELVPAVGVARSRPHTVSFVIHDFMHEHCLDPDRIRACAFKVMTANGPMSMCMVNAKRDSLILEPVAVGTAADARYWNPLTGEYSSKAPSTSVSVSMHPLKRLKGRVRKERLLERA
ncbi:MAG: radical SAM protein [Pseudomonadota bacterium]